MYGASISKDTVSRITDRVVEEMQAWCSRPLQGVYAAIFIDAIYVKVRDGQVGNQPFYAAIGVDLAGHRDVLGLWAGKGGGESAKFWMNVLTDLKNRGVTDVFFIVCDGLKGLPDAVNAVFPPAIVQACIIHLIRATFRYASSSTGTSSPRTCADLHRADRGGRLGGVRGARGEVGQALPGDRAALALGVGAVHPVPGLRPGDPQGALLHQRDRVAQRPLPQGRAVKGHFPTEQAAIKCLYLVTRALDPKGTGQARWTIGGSPRSTRSRSPSPRNTGCLVSGWRDLNSDKGRSRRSPSVHSDARFRRSAP